MKVSILMPSYNQARHISKAIQSAVNQVFWKYNTGKYEIIIMDDASTDNTVEVIKRFQEKYPFIKLVVKEKNEGVGKNINDLVKEATGDIIVFLCTDDYFTSEFVVDDMYEAFKNNPNLGVIGRPYYQYFYEKPKKIAMAIRSNILISSCQPSGMGFRKNAIVGEFSDRMFVEVPSMVARILTNHWDGSMMSYDTIAACLHFNAAIDPEYFAPEQSQVLNWFLEVGIIFIYPMYFIQLKSRYPSLLFKEIKNCIKIKPSCLLSPWFIFCALVAIIVPGKILIHLSRFYRYRIVSLFARKKVRHV